MIFVEGSLVENIPIYERHCKEQARREKIRKENIRNDQDTKDPKKAQKGKASQGFSARCSGPCMRFAVVGSCCLRLFHHTFGTHP